MAKTKKAGAQPKLTFREEKEVDLDWIHIGGSQAFKTLFLGDSSVGKTCLAKLFVEQQVVKSSTNTIGFDHLLKEVELKDGVSVQLQIWDTAGMEQFRSSLITKYYRNAHGVVLVYDITNPDSFNNLEKWVNEIKHYCSLENVQMVLIGNKLDQEHDRKVSTEAGQKFADRYGMPTFVEMSAMNIDNLPLLEETLAALAQRMFDEREEKEMTLSSRGVIRLGKGSLLDEWEIVEPPKEPIPRHIYAHQDARARRSTAFSKSCKC